VDLTIQPVRTARDRREFFRFPWTVYAGDPLWVPPLLADLEKQFDPSRNPFFEHAEVESFLARAEGRPVGRICAITNNAHVDFHREPVGFFGFFEVWDGEGSPRPDGLETTRALLEAAGKWVRERGLSVLRGPMNFSTNDTCGVLVRGFDDPPAVMMTYNPPHYDQLLRGAGLEKAKDLVAYYLHRRDIEAEKLQKAAALIERKQGFTVRSLNKKRFREELELIKEIYNAAWEENWGFVPMTPAEIDHMAGELKPFLDENLVVFVEKDGEAFGFAWGLADWNRAVRHANGRLFPFGLLKILWHARRIRKIRILTLGLKKEFRGQGADNLLYLRLYLNGVRKGYEEGEFSWILEDNQAIRKPLEKLGARVYKTYRIYETSLP
jgi:GNAT superfamily N-acetyltransferase